MSAPSLTASAAHLDQVELPSAEEEIWRYSRIGQLELARFRPVDCVTTVVGLGELSLVESDEQLPAPGDVFDALVADCGAVTRLTVPRNHVHPGIVEIERRAEVDGGLVATALVIDAGENSEITIVERFVSSDEISALSLSRLVLRAGQAARVRYLAINEFGRSTWSIGSQDVSGERDSTINLATVAIGGDYSRVRTHATSTGPGATTKQTTLYFADGDQMHDFRVIQEHVAPRTSSDLLFKGAVAGRAASVYTGLIKIGPEGRGTAAYQTNRTLTLSSGAWAESVPNLEIETNDVKCSHASTIGPVDEEQRFYLESRGIQPEVAERLIVLGFFDEVLTQIAGGEHVARLRAEVAAKLERRIA